VSVHATDDPADDLTGAAALLDVTRDLADRVWRSKISSADRHALAVEIGALAHRLEPLVETAPVNTSIGGRLPGRGHPLLPPLIRGEREGRALGTVSFTTAHAGAGTAVHGGYLALLFDEVLGSVAVSAFDSRTASITVNYRNLTPMNTPLAVEGWVDRVDGRKVHVEGRLLDGDRVCADAQALFIKVAGWE
jgi:acyl-coenzyme A thioesterase PaaI-like protein